MNLQPIQEKLKSPDIEPGSPEERALLEQARAQRDADTDEFTAVHMPELKKEGGPLGVVRVHEAQNAAAVAIEHVTGQHPVVTVPPSTPDIR